MNIKKLFIPLAVVVVSFVVLTSNVIASNIPTISTACESKSGELTSFNDGFSFLKKCNGDNRRVILIGQQGPKGDKGDTGPQGPKGDKGDPAPTDTGKHILDSAQYQSTNIWTTTSSADVATPSQITLNCPVKCVLSVNYWADNRTDSLPAPGAESQAYQIIYVDGVRSINYSSAIFSVVGDPLMVSMGGLFPVNAGTHTVQIYAWQNYGTLDIREKVLTGIAFEQ